MSDPIFRWMWDQVGQEFNSKDSWKYQKILEYAWQGKTYQEMAELLPYSEIYIHQDLSRQAWKVLSNYFGVRISKNLLKPRVVEIYDGNNAFPEAEQSQMLSHQSPFGDRGCITDDARFYDRVEVTHQVFEHLGRNWNISLIGDREIGKSSLMAKICREAPSALQIGPEQLVYLDLQLIHTEKVFFEQLCKALGIEDCRGYDLLHALQDRQYIICIDEIEKMNSPNFSGNEREELRGLSDGEAMPFTLITASRTPLEELFPDEERSTSPFFNIFQQLHIGKFSPSIARDFLLDRLRDTSVMFTNQEIQTLITESDGHPACLQKLAQSLYEERLQAHLEIRHMA